MTHNEDYKLNLQKMTIAYQEALEIHRLKTGFLGRIGHEIRSPLSTIMSLHQLIINDLCDNPQEEKESIKQAYQYTKKLMAMIDQIIEISKLEVGKINLEIEEFNLIELIEDIYEIIALEARNKNLQTKLQINDDRSMIKNDKVRLTNLLFYLLEIAIDATESGIITIDLNSVNQNQYLITISFLTNNPSLETKQSIIQENSSIEELKKLHTSPEFSIPMKIMLAQTISQMMQGKLLIQKAKDTPKNLTELSLFLPVETLPSNL